MIDADIRLFSSQQAEWHRHSIKINIAKGA
jgi:hypothetical protein